MELLPESIIDNILTFCDIPSLFSLRCTNKNLRSIVSKDSVWEWRCKENIFKMKTFGPFNIVKYEHYKSIGRISEEMKHNLEYKLDSEKYTDEWNKNLRRNAKLLTTIHLYSAASLMYREDSSFLMDDPDDAQAEFIRKYVTPFASDE